MMYCTKFAIGDKVSIDGDPTLTGRITAINLFHSGTTYKVAWFNQGVSESDDFDEFRLENA